MGRAPWRSTGDGTSMDRLLGRQRLGPGWVSHLLQDAVAHLWRSRAVDPAAVAAAYGARRDALLGALRRRGIAAHGRSGLNVWVPVADETSAVAGLLRAGWAAAPGARFRMSSPPGVRLTVASLPPDDAVPLADALAAATRPAPARRYV